MNLKEVNSSPSGQISIQKVVFFDCLKCLCACQNVYELESCESITRKLVVLITGISQCELSFPYSCF